MNSNDLSVLIRSRVPILVIDESGRNLRESLATADLMAPCVLWIDEIEKGFSGAEIEQAIVAVLYTAHAQHVTPNMEMIRNELVSTRGLRRPHNERRRVNPPPCAFHIGFCSTEPAPLEMCAYS